MGATTFYQNYRCSTNETSADEAFRAAREQAAYEHGHGGYTGSLAEKSSFVMIATPRGKDYKEHAWDLIDDCDPRVNDKWGPAGCIRHGAGYYFFGWASE